MQSLHGFEHTETKMIVKNHQIQVMNVGHSLHTKALPCSQIYNTHI